MEFARLQDVPSASRKDSVHCRSARGGESRLVRKDYYYLGLLETVGIVAGHSHHVNLTHLTLMSLLRGNAFVHLLC